jgi:hypothetical protein
VENKHHLYQKPATSKHVVWKWNRKWDLLVVRYITVWWSLSPTKILCECVIWASHRCLKSFYWDLWIIHSEVVIQWSDNTPVRELLWTAVSSQSFFYGSTPLHKLLVPWHLLRYYASTISLDDSLVFVEEKDVENKRAIFPLELSYCLPVK